MRREDFFLDRVYSFDYFHKALFKFGDDGVLRHRNKGLNPYFT
jgi:hypothetical protein